MNVYTRSGWVERVDHLHESDICCDCDQPATVITNAGPRQCGDGDTIYWAQCEGCADETQCERIDAHRQAVFDCEPGFSIEIEDPQNYWSER